jgi:hypothetical protein
MKRLLILWCLFLTACSGGNPSPTSPATPTPTPTTFSLTGQITGSDSGALDGATLLIADGPNKGQSTITDTAGHYSFTGLQQSAFTLNASANGYSPQNKAASPTSNQPVSFLLLKVNPLFALSGLGNMSFDMPTNVARVRITGSYAGDSSSFVVNIGGHQIVNALIGTGQGSTAWDGTYVNPGGAVEITDSAGVSWSFNEVR